MTVRTVQNARRRLRSLRIQDALGMRVSSSQEMAIRDRLIPYLQGQTVSEQLEISPDLDRVIDAAVTAALAAPDESTIDHVIALASAAHVLARYSEFARLKMLSAGFIDVAERLSPSRPFLAATYQAFVHVLQGERPQAQILLMQVLGLDSEALDARVTAPRTWENIGDVLLASGLREWLDSGDLRLLRSIVGIAVDRRDGVLLVLAESLLEYTEAATRSDIFTVVSAHAPRFGRGILAEYLRRRGVDTLFPAQVNAIENQILDRGNHLVALPTSSGKTFLAELRIAIQLERSPDSRVLYLAPYRLLARQVEQDLRDGLRVAKITVRDLGSAYDLDVGEELESGKLPEVAVMTPERLDALMRLATTDRKGSEAAADLLSTARLLVFDEVQLIGRSSRGPRIELFLTRLRQQYPEMSIVGLAAATHGIEGLADWLNAPPPYLDGRRPTGTIEVIWKTDGTMYQRFDGGMSKIGESPRSTVAINDAAALVAHLRSDQFPALLVMTKRADAENVVEKIRKSAPREGLRWRKSLAPNQRSLLETVADLATATMGEGNQLANLLLEGLAFHHAGVPPHLLRAIERLVEERCLRAVGATTTVAEGAHLPFHVAIVPHLYFYPSGPLEKGLYQNIVGRAGRANVAIEGLVIILDSDASSVRGYVETTLWNDEVSTEVDGQLARALVNTRMRQDYERNREVQSQVLAWIGDAGSYVADQPLALAERTFSWHEGTDAVREAIVSGLVKTLESLEADGLAVAASPFRLTHLGERARLAGLSPRSCVRLDRALERFRDVILQSSVLAGYQIRNESARIISELILETEEVLEKSLWFRRLKLDSREEATMLTKLSKGDAPWPQQEESFQVDLGLLQAWMQGVSYEAMGDIPPVYGDKSLFGSKDRSTRTSDVADYISDIAYPAAWAWSGITAMLGQDGDSMPSWVRQAINLGVPTETGCELVRRYNLSRGAAVTLASHLSPQWDLGEFELLELSTEDLKNLRLSTTDMRQLRMI